MKRDLRLVFVTQLIDPDDPVLGFTVGWIRALAARFAQVAVVANEVRTVPADLSADVVSLGKERGAKRVQRTAAYLAALGRLLPQLRPHALFVHMCPQYLNLAAPLLVASRIPGILWFAHPSDTFTLRVAERVGAVVLTSLPGAFPFASSKVRVIGQGIDVRRFESVCAPSAHDGLRLLTLGRLSPSKGLETIIRAVVGLRTDGIPVALRVVGPATTPTEAVCARRLRELVGGNGTGVSFEPPVPPGYVPQLLAEVDTLVNGTRAGSGDKVVFEAMAAHRIVIYSNPSFDSLTAGLPIRLRYREDDADDLAHAVKCLWQTPPRMRLQVGTALAHRVAERHSVDTWADRVLGVVTEASRKR